MSMFFYIFNEIVCRLASAVSELLCGGGGAAAARLPFHDFIPLMQAWDEPRKCRKMSFGSG